MQVSDVTVESELEPPAPSLAERLRALRRRSRPMAITFAGIFVAAALAALLWPPTYRSTGTILIEQQEVPTEFVRSAVTSYADQRVQMISQRVMTSANLLAILDKYKLYPGDRDRATREALVDRLRDNIDLQMISADVVDPRQGRPTKATIAFSVSFDSRSPVIAGQVANELATLYLSENIESRRQLAADTAGFLKEESERLGARVTELESRIATFKGEHGSNLPEYTALNLQMLDRSQQELRSVETRLQSLDQQVVFLDAQLAQLSPNSAAFTETGERVLSAPDRLKMLQGQLAAAQARYSPDHPDVIRLRREIEGLQAQLAASGAASAPAAASSTALDPANDIARQIEAARAELASARQRYDEAHPDVQRLARQVTSLQLALQQTPRRSPVPAAISAPLPAAQDADNPAYIQIRAQRAAALTERAALAAQFAGVRARIASLERGQTLAPDVEKDYSALQRDLAGEQTKYNEVRQKLLEAQLAQNLETERKGERFTLIEPPVQPQQPVKPNRPAILVLGFVFALAAAFLVMLVLEQTDTRIRDRSHVAALLSVPPLAVIPAMPLEEDIQARLDLQRKLGFAAAGALVLVLVTVHFLVQPLDIVWLRLLRRLGVQG